MKKIIYRNIAQECTKFFLLILFTISIIIWVLQAVNYLDFVIEDGHGFLVYFNYTLLSFPKIISRIFPFALFLSISYTLLRYENNNELVIFWNFGINKIRFANFFLKISIGFFLVNILLNSIITPFTQDKARSFIRTSDLDFFESILKPKKFIDIVQDLTIYFDSKNESGELKRIYLKDNSSIDNFQITFAKKGILELRDDRKVLVLYDGNTINNKEGKISEFKFSKTDYNITKFSSKSTSSVKTQEHSTMELIQCLLILKNTTKENEDKIYSFSNCRLSNIKNIYEELYSRLIKPVYNTHLILIALLLILKSKDDYTFLNYKIKVYTFGFLFIIFLETSSKFIGTNFLYNISLMMVPFFLFIFIYIYFWTTLNDKKI